MHELSIAMQVVETVEQALAGEGEIKVLSVTIQVGALTAVVPEALRFVWPIAARGSRAEAAALEIVPVAATGFCLSCQSSRTIPDLKSFRCSACAMPLTEISGGKALQVSHVEVEDLSRRPQATTGVKASAGNCSVTTKDNRHGLHE